MWLQSTQSWCDLRVGIWVFWLSQGAERLPTGSLFLSRALQVAAQTIRTAAISLYSLDVYTLSIPSTGDSLNFQTSPWLCSHPHLETDYLRRLTFALLWMRNFKTNRPPRIMKDDRCQAILGDRCTDTKKGSHTNKGGGYLEANWQSERKILYHPA